MYNFRTHPCVRIQLDNIQKGERHPCFFCGFAIDVGALEDCPECGLKKCPGCGKCLCTITDNERDTLIRIHKTYCCNRAALLDFEGISLEGDEIIIRRATKSLEYCSTKFRAGNAYPFLRNLATGNIANPYFGHDVSEWMRYAVFGLGNIPRSARTVLDIGPGYSDGIKIYLENRKDIRVFALDLNMGNLDDLEGNERVTLIQGDIRGLEAIEVKFDFISAFEVIEHVSKEDGLDVLDEIASHLNPRGVFVLSTPNRGGLHSGQPQGTHLWEWEYDELFLELDKRFRITRTYGNRIDMSRFMEILTPKESSLLIGWRKCLPDAILANLFCLNHPREAMIGVFVCRRRRDPWKYCS